MTNPSKAYKNRPILSNSEINQMLVKADLIPDELRKLRAKALIALLKKYGKRRSELCRLKINNLLINNNFLEITFIISKKHKKGLFQYFKYCKNQIRLGKLSSNYLDNKKYSELINEWQIWTATKEGFRIKTEERTKKLSIEDKYAKLIIEYWNYMKTNHPGASYLFASCQYAFGNRYNVSCDSHLSGRHLLRIIKPLNPNVWLHLFRETKGAEIAKEFGNNLAGITQVRETLDLENESTAYHYVRRYAIQEIKSEP